MDIQTILLNYGVLGIWTTYLLYEKRILFNKLSASIDELRYAIIKNNSNGKPPPF